MTSCGRCEGLPHDPSVEENYAWFQATRIVFQPALLFRAHERVTSFQLHWNNFAAVSFKLLHRKLKSASGLQTRTPVLYHHHHLDW